jgi:hypothetical protein
LLLDRVDQNLLLVQLLLVKLLLLLLLKLLLVLLRGEQTLLLC